MTDQRILVMGVGNPLMRDEGIGPRVIELLLDGYVFPDNVSVEDAGTMGYMILDLLKEADRLIVVDAIKDSGHPAGTVLMFSPEDLASNQVMHSMHDLRLVDVLEAAELTGHAPEAVVIGVQIESIEEWVLELSEAAEAALPVAAAAVLEQLAELGVVPAAREEGRHVSASIIEAMRTFEPVPEEALRPESEK